MQILRVDNICKKVNGKIIYKDINMEINKGECYAIVGPDDSGKTSLINTILGFEKRNKGDIYWFNNKKLNNKVLRRVGYVPDDLLCFNRMSGAEFLDITLKFNKGRSNVEEAEELISFFEVNPSICLDEMEEDMNKCFYIISAIMKKPEVLILDEPFVFLKERSSGKLREFLKSYLKVGNTVIILNDNMQQIKDICTTFSAIKYGIQLIQDEKVDKYATGKIITVYGCNNKEGELGKLEGINMVKEGKEESIYIYTGDTEGIKLFLQKLKCANFNVNDMTIDNQIFKDFTWMVF